MSSDTKKPKKTECQNCGKFCSASYLKKHGICGKCYMADYDELKSSIILIKNINDLCFDMLKSKKSQIERLFDLNLLIDELIVSKMKSLTVDID